MVVVRTKRNIRRNNIMGLISLIKNVAGTITGTIGDEIRDQYLEFFTCDSLGDNILVKKGANRMQKGRNVGSSEIISQGSVIAVPEGTALLLVDGGQIVDFTMVAGYYRWDSSTSPSVFAPGGFGENIKKTVVDAWTRMKQGGELSKQQRVYFVNLLEIRNQNFGTPSPVSYEDPAYLTVYIRLNGTFSYRIQDPVTFFRNISGNIADVYTNDDFMGTPSKPLQPRLEFLDHITEALNKCCIPTNERPAIKFSQLPAHQGEFRNYMAEVLDQDWLQTRGVVVQAVAIGSVTPDDETRARIQDIQTNQIYGRDQAALGAYGTRGIADGIKAAGSNEAGAGSAGAGIGMLGAAALTMANTGMMGGNPMMGGAGAMGAGAAMGAAGAAAAPAGWTCSCGQAGNQGNFCMGCGAQKPAPAAPAAAGWTCSCGQTGNQGNFCQGCGAKKPAPVTCPKCGWQPAAGQSSKFCPECGTQLQ